MRTSLKLLIILILTFILATCVDEYNPKLNRLQSLLVVDALITDEDKPNVVTLSRTNNIQNEEKVMVSGAEVYISDEYGNRSDFEETIPGYYLSDSSLFQGRTGSTYILSVKTPDGKQYRSEPCVMYPVVPVKNIYYEKDQEIKEKEIKEGLRIFIDTEESEGGYFRWTYNEWWKIVVPDPKKYYYINDSTFLPVDTIKQTCWGNNNSNEIIIQNNGGQYTAAITGKPILFIDSDETNRLAIRYFIEVKQLSVSEKEYTFWNNLVQVNESSGNIFDKQPFPVVSNIHNMADPEEPVLGYFQVSAVSSNKIYINVNQVIDLGLNVFRYDCEKIEISPADFPPDEIGGGVSFDDLFKIYEGPVHTFIEPICNENRKLIRMVFSKKECADCTIKGSLQKPDFWID